jgi:hypothetical protein
MGNRLIPENSLLSDINPHNDIVYDLYPTDIMLVESETEYIAPTTRTGKLVGFLGLFTYADEGDDIFIGG